MHVDLLFLGETRELCKLYGVGIPISEELRNLANIRIMPSTVELGTVLFLNFVMPRPTTSTSSIPQNTSSLEGS